ncbi:MAG: DUF58 domain-containing protein [Lachnospiraceae bacterium]|nr:DUF58 domain-containing protein [Lachnospiraceae bacterium]
MQRKYHILYIIGYIIVLALFMLGTLFYRQSLLVVLLLLIFMIIPLSVFATAKTAERLSVSLIRPEGHYPVGKQIELKIMLSNPSFLPMLNCRLNFTLGNSLYESFSNELTIAAEAKKDTTVVLPLDTAQAGLIRIRFSSLSVTDFLHICTFTMPYKDYAEIPVLPAERELPALRLSKAVVETEDSVQSGEGELTTDIKQIREYRVGDRLRDIHWKQSAKAEDILVKEYERSKELYYLILPEMERDFFKDDLENIYALGRYLIKQKETFRVALTDPETGSVEICVVTEEEELLTVLFKIYTMYGGLKSGESSGIYERFEKQYPDMYGVIRIRKGVIVTPVTVEQY